MKVKELIEALQKMPQDIEVYGFCDHGQVPEKVCLPVLAYTDEDLAQSLWEAHCTDKEEAEEWGYENKFVIL